MAIAGQTVKYVPALFRHAGHSGHIVRLVVSHCSPVTDVNAHNSRLSSMFATVRPDGLAFLSRPSERRLTGSPQRTNGRELKHNSDV